MRKSTLIIAAGAVGFACLVCGSADAITITVRGGIQSSMGQWGGIEVLFALLGATVGRLSPALAERTWEGSLLGLALLGAAWSVAALMGGLAFATAYRGVLPTGTWTMVLIFLAGTAVGIGAWCFKEYFGADP